MNAKNGLTQRAPAPTNLPANIPDAPTYAALPARMDRSVPMDIQAEMATLGAMLFAGEEGVKACEAAADLLCAADFYRTSHHTIFDAILAVQRAGIPLDIVTLRAELVKRGKLDEVGAEGYLLTLMDFTPTIDGLPHYAGVVHEKAVLRRLIEASATIAGMAYGAEIPVRDIATKAEEIVFAAGGSVRNLARGDWKSAKALANTYMDGLFERHRAGGGFVGVPSGFVKIDNILTGFKRGDLYILASRPAMGKTATVVSTGLNAAKAGNIVGIFSQEMTDDAVMERLISQEAMVDSRRMQLGRLTDEELDRISDAAARIYELPLHIVDTQGLTPSEMFTLARRLRAKEGGLDLLINDYLQMGEDDQQRSRNTDERIRVGNIAGQMKAIAKKLDVPNITISSLSRSCERREDKRPMLSDLAESGAIEYHADGVIFLYRASYYAPAEDAPGPNDVDEMEIIVAKQRKGPTGTVKVGYLPRFTKVVNLDERHEGTWQS